MVCSHFVIYGAITFLPVLYAKFERDHSYIFQYYLLLSIDTIILLCAEYLANTYAVIMFIIPPTSLITISHIVRAPLERSIAIPTHRLITCVIIVIHVILTIFTAFKSVKVRKLALSFIYGIYCLHLPLSIVFYF